MNTTSLIYYDTEEKSKTIVLDLSHSNITTTSEINGSIKNSNNLIYGTLNLSNNLLTNNDFKLNKIVNINYCIHLILDHNDLNQLLLKTLPKSIKKITCRYNNITDFNGIIWSKKMKTIQEIDLSHNPICDNSNYRLKLLNIMPSLRKINGVKVSKEERRLNKKQIKA